MAQNQTTAQLPQVVETTLKEIKRRSMRLKAIEGFLGTLAALLALMLLAMAMDWVFVIFDTRIRMLLTLSACSISALVFLLYCLRPLLSQQRLSSVAMTIDASIPSLEERLSTVAELAESEDPPEIRGADSLIERVSREAEELTPMILPAKIMPSSNLIRKGLLLAGAFGVLVLLFVLAPGETGILVRRFWAPAANISQTVVTSLTGDAVIPRKESLTLEANLSGRRQNTATLILETAQDEKEITLYRSALPSATAAFTYTIPSVEDTFRYRVRSGDGQTDWHHVTAVNRPTIAQVQFRITPPEYSSLPLEEQDGLPAQVRALEGSLLEIDLAASKAGVQVELKQENERKISVPIHNDPWHRYSAVLADSTAFSILLTDEYGFTNLNPPSCRITVYADRPPAVQIVSPETEIFALPEDKIPIAFEASDDFGITQAELVVTTEGPLGASQETILPIPLGEQQNALKVEGRTELDLSQFDLKQGQELTYAVRVADTRQSTAESISNPDTQSSPSSSSERSSEPLAYNEANNPSERNSHSPSNEKYNEPNEAQNSAGGNAPKKNGENGNDKQAGTEKPSNTPNNNNNQGESGSSNNSDSPTGKQSTDNPQSSGANSQPPPNDLKKRPDPNRSNTACSNAQRIQVDEWAGQYEGQGKEKLKIDIKEFMERIDQALAKAEILTGNARNNVRSKKYSNEKLNKDLESANNHLGQATAVIADLRNRSDGTPYEFMGLQMQDIADQQIRPARKHAQESRTQFDESTRSEHLDQAVYLIGKARQRIADLTKEFEEIKRTEQLAEEIERVTKMHQVFAEEMAKFLEASKPTLNPRTGKMTEVSEEYVEKLKKQLEEQKKLLSELAKILAQDPDLLKRYMAMMRLDSTTVRDQLTLLAMRQQSLAEQIAAWNREGTADIPERQKEWLDKLAQDQMEIAGDVDKLHDNLVTWMPPDAPTATVQLAKCIRETARSALSTRDAAIQISSGKVSQALEQAEMTAAGMQSLMQDLETARESNSESAKMASYTGNRMEEASDVAYREEGWSEKVTAAKQGDYGKAASVDQDRLTRDTQAFGAKIDRLIPLLSQMPGDIGGKSRELSEIVDTEIVKEQTSAFSALVKENMSEADQFQRKTVAAFAKAETIFDELLTLIEEENAKKPAPQEPCNLPSLEEILAMLQNEAKACEKLGAACRMLNIQIESDWQSSGTETGTGSSGKDPGNKPSPSQQQSQRPDENSPAQSLERMVADAQARASQAAAKEMARTLEKARQEATKASGASSSILAGGKPSYSGDGGPVETGAWDEKDSNAAERDWNVLASKLKDELRQGRESNAPEPYRQAIQEYFKAISEAASRGAREKE